VVGAVNLRIWLHGHFPSVSTMDNNIYTQIGVVLIIALASKNAILIVEFARELRLAKRSIFQAATEAARMRFRPIIMTSFAFILGVLPLVFATGPGAGSRRSLGTAVCGGMLTATVLAVFFVPVFYVAIQSLIELLHGPPQPPPGFHAPGEHAEYEMTVEVPHPVKELASPEAPHANGKPEENGKPTEHGPPENGKPTDGKELPNGKEEKVPTKEPAPTAEAK
jgi:HAE1 family hydrophobic/amphiphilic exporter-1